MLSHTPSGTSDGMQASGGKSLLVDGFNAAGILQREDPESFEILRRKGVAWHASGNQGITITPDADLPVIQTTRAKLLQPPRIVQIRWNNDDRAGK